MRRLIGLFGILAVIGTAALAAERPLDFTSKGISITAFNAFTGPPGFDAAELYIKELRERVARHELDETSETEFFDGLGIKALTMSAKPQLTEWQQTHPHSAIPILAPLIGRLHFTVSDLIPTFSTLAAWHASPDALKEVQRIKSVLLSVKPTASHDPYWYTLMAQVLVAERAPTSEVDALVDEGLAKHPSNINFVLAASNHYLGKWSGSSQALEVFAARMGDRFAEREGQAMYARIYAHAMRAQYAGQLFDLTNVDWQRVMTGLRDLIARRPSDKHRNQAAVMGCLGGNRKLTRELLSDTRFIHLDVYWYLIVPGNSGNDTHDVCRHWANSPPSQPAAVQPATASP